MTVAGSGGDSREPDDGQRPSAGFTVAEPGAVTVLARLRRVGNLLEAVVWLAVAGSVLAFGAVHPWAYQALWLVITVAGLVALARTATVIQARRLLGRRAVGLHSAGRWAVVEPTEQEDALTWRCDLSAPVLGRVPLLWPGCALTALAVLQLVAWPPTGATVTLSAEATRRGLLFVAALLTLHLAAAAGFSDPGARRRLRQLVAWLGLVLGFVALFQLASGVEKIYGLFQPWESTGFYGPFVNRNHFAGYMLLVIPVGLGLLGGAWHRYRRRVGGHANLRRRLVGIGSEQGTRLVYAVLPPLVAIAALLASTSRGGLLAFAASLALAVFGLRRRSGTPVWAAALVFVAVALSWFGLERLEVRFARATDDAPGRTVVWGESVALMNGSRWATGYGLNTFAEALSRVPAWELPEGATPWPEPTREALESGQRYGYRAPGDLPGLAWYREAHNDWVQLLVETGLPGLAVGIWAAIAVLLAARGDPWLFAALAGPLIHASVDFDFQIPAVSVLFVVLAALGGRSAQSSRKVLSVSR